MNQKNYNGQRHGLWEEFHPIFQLRCKCNFVNGLLHGPYESYYTNGNLFLKGVYQNDQEVGLWLEGYSDGKIRKRFYL